MRLLKQDVSLRSIPVILVTAKADTRDVVEGWTPAATTIDQTLRAQGAAGARRDRCCGRRALHDTVAERRPSLQDQAAQLSAWNRSLEANSGRAGDGNRANGVGSGDFLPAQVADLIVAADDGDALSKATAAR